MTAISPSKQHHNGFSITELLVVIGIIVLLAGILLVALGNVRDKAKRTATEGIMNSFAAACDTFQLEHGRYPGVVPDRILAEDPYQISSTENALLELMGGFVREADFADTSIYANDYTTADGWEEIVIAGPNGNYRIKVNRSRIGEGPIIDGTPYPPYFTPKSDEVAVMIGEQIGEPANRKLPDLLDDWGQPILYLRQTRTRGPLAADIGNANPQFYREVILPYVESTELGELGIDQTKPVTSRPFSVLNEVAVDQWETLAQVLRHPALPETARGAYLLVSAGPDGIYFSSHDGPGSPSNPVSDITTMPSASIVEEYDDVRIFGGG